MPVRLTADLLMKLLALLGAQLGAVVPQFMNLPNWHAAGTPQFVGQVLLTIVSVTGAWFAKSPRQAQPPPAPPAKA